MKYILGFLTAFILIVILIIMLVSGGHKSKSPAAVTTPKKLVSYSDSDALVRLTVDGPVNAQQQHEQDQITVGKDNVTYKKISGYNGEVVETKMYDNNSNAYAAFLQSLSHAGFNRGDKNSLLKDERGYCALGNRYIYELISGGQTIQRYWSTSCNKPKTYLGNNSLTLELFKKQVPDYGKPGSKFEFGTSF